MFYLLYLTPSLILKHFNWSTMTVFCLLCGKFKKNLQIFREFNFLYFYLFTNSNFLKELCKKIPPITGFKCLFFGMRWKKKNNRSNGNYRIYLSLIFETKFLYNVKISYSNNWDQVFFLNFHFSFYNWTLANYTNNCY